VDLLSPPLARHLTEGESSASPARGQKETGAVVVARPDTAVSGVLGAVAAITGDTVTFCDGVAVAVNVTAVNPATVAVNWFVPGAGPSVQLPTVAMPELLVEGRRSRRTDKAYCNVVRQTCRSESRDNPVRVSPRHCSYR
jgi:hypothetical protein